MRTRRDMSTVLTWMLLVCVACGLAAVDKASWVRRYKLAMAVYRTDYEDELKLHEKEYQEAVQENAAKIDGVFAEFKHSCSSQHSDTPPTTVHELMVGDIDVVAAMGDAFTAGTGVSATTLDAIVTNNPESSWITGGIDGSQRTIANIIRHFNPDVTGFSENATQPGLNVAVPGSTSADLKVQANVLVELMKNYPGVDMENHWKLVTIYMGRNDLCWMRAMQDQLGPTQYANDLMDALRILRAGLPRTLVNVVLPPLMPLWQGPGSDSSQSLVYDLQTFMCRYLIEPDQVEGLREDFRNMLYTARDAMLHGNLTTKTFAIVGQPCFVRNVLPRVSQGMSLPQQEDGSVDPQYFAPDYFHYNAVGQGAMATALWNVMFQPVTRNGKDFESPYTLNTPLHCPREKQYLATRWNNMEDRPWDEEEPEARSWGSAELMTGLGVTTGVILVIVIVTVIIMTVQGDKYKRRNSLKPVVDMDELAESDFNIQPRMSI